MENLIKLDGLYESLRYADYSFENSVGELVDNSIEAGAGKIAIVIRKSKGQETGKKKPKTTLSEIAVIDDGAGMESDTLSRCLLLGESICPLEMGKRGIGRFGLGMKLGGYSIARRIEIYSRRSPNEQFICTHMDLDEIKSNAICVPAPTVEQPDPEYAELVNGSSGTIVILKKCDRAVECASGKTSDKSSDASELLKGLASYLGRVYRKYIAAGLNVTLDGVKVYLHDPLYLLGPTVFDVMQEEGTDRKALPMGEDKITVDLPNGQKAQVTIKMSLLPEEWRKDWSDVGTPGAKKRKLDQNEGVSILRAEREIYYGPVPYVVEKRGEALTMEIDKWWGCEISFPPELDDYFRVKCIKREVDPIPAMQDQIRERIGGKITTMRRMLQAEQSRWREERDKLENAFGSVEQAMSRACRVLPGLPNGCFSVELADYPQNVLFDVAQTTEQTILKLNRNHVFYKKVIFPLSHVGDEEDLALASDKRKFSDSILLMLLSFAKAELGNDQCESLSKEMRERWGTVLAAAVSEYGQGE